MTIGELIATVDTLEQEDLIAFIITVINGLDEDTTRSLSNYIDLLDTKNHLLLKSILRGDSWSNNSEL